MKPVRLVLTPTRNRRLNELVGMLVLASAILLFLALVSYRPTDPSFNTVGPGPVRNWIGPVGAHLSDLLLQFEGLSAYLLPLLLGALGWTWIRSRPAGSPGAKLLGILLSLLFCPALLGLLPSQPRFPWGLPVAGLTGRLVADLLVSFLNYPGACIVTVTLVAVAMYLSTTFSFNTAREWISIKFAFVLAWRDRWANWRKARARRKELRAAEKADRLHEKEVQRAQKAAEKEAKRAAKAARKSPIPDTRSAFAEDADEAIHARRAGFAETQAPVQIDPVPSTPGLWDQMPRTVAPDPPAIQEAPEETPPPRPQLVPKAPKPEPVAANPPNSISIGERADTEVRTVTVASKSVTGFRLPPSTLLHRSDDPSPVREDVLRTSAQVLVEKCAEFDVTGQVVQINPGPVV
ncbi:MAG TPA: DNA translocase FtsK 4TM domain-containing protein, partial [Acidobacteriaceae bacterium]|nr:DNA translocase FtsK 4TM domain-containing protein [Acidobacteriaceae bacterium]